MRPNCGNDDACIGIQASVACILNGWPGPHFVFGMAHLEGQQLGPHHRQCTLIYSVQQTP